MHQDKKTQELEEIREFEQLQQEEMLEQQKEKVSSKTDENVESEKDWQTVENEMERATKRKKELIFELSLFLMLGILVGITIKTEAAKRITIGFNDYQIETGKQRYDVDAMKKNIERKAAALQAETQQQTSQAQKDSKQTSQVQPQSNQ